MRVKILFSLTVGIICQGCSTNNPKKDGLSVCKCYNEIEFNKGDAAMSAGIRKCMGLYGDLAIKYKEKPSQMIEFVTYSDSCSKSK